MGGFEGKKWYYGIYILKYYSGYHVEHEISKVTLIPVGGGAALDEDGVGKKQSDLGYPGVRKLLESFAR